LTDLIKGIEDIKADISFMSSTSYVECDQIPLLELQRLHERLIDAYKAAHTAK